MTYELVLGDALQILPTLEAGSIDAIVTDLPYGTTACAWDEVIPFEPMWEQVKRVLKPRGVFVTTASQPFTSALVMSNAGWFKYAWVWDKGVSGSFACADVMPLKTHEDVCVFSPSSRHPDYKPQMTKRNMPMRIGGVHAGSSVGGRSIDYNPSLLSNEKMYDFAYPKSVLALSPRADKERGYHPTQKPVALYSYLIRTYTNPGDTVLDFCMGSGTTGVAAIKEGRNFVGVELDAEYHAIAQKRIADAAAQPMLLDVTV